MASDQNTEHDSASSTAAGAFHDVGSGITPDGYHQTNRDTSIHAARHAPGLFQQPQTAPLLALFLHIAEAADLAPEALTDMPWADFGYTPNTRETADQRPEILAIGQNGAFAIWDPIQGRVITTTGAFSVTNVDALGLCADGDVLVAYRDTLSRRGTSGELRGELTLRATLPTGAALVMDGETVMRLSVEGSEAVAIAASEGLKLWMGESRATVAPTVKRLARNSGGSTLQVNGRDVLDTNGYASGRVLGDWLLVEERSVEDVGAVGLLGVRRTLVNLSTGNRTAPITTQGWLYRPGLTLGPDGSIAWLAPTAEGLEIWRVRAQ